MAEQSFDVAVIGAGPGGYVAAIRMAQLGLKVAVVEKQKLGGVCLNWGCIPSKALIYGATMYEKLTGSAEMGIIAKDVRLDFEKLVSWKDGVVKKLTGGIGQLFKNHGIQTIYGTAQFQDKNTLQITDAEGKNQTLKAKNYLIATGSSFMSLPNVQIDHQVIIDAADTLSLESLPKKLVCIGGGVIALELGMMFAKLGTQVQIVEMMPRLLPNVDSEVVDYLMRILKRKGVQVHLSAKAQSIDVGDKEASVSIEGSQGKRVLDADKVLVAIGQRPNSAGLNLEKIGVKLDAKGFIVVDQQLKTSVPNIFAIGDVVGAPLLAHKASKEGLIAADVIAGKNSVLDYRAMPFAIFTDPEIASVGLTEDEAKEKGHTVKTGKFPFAASGRALSMGETDGFVKVISDANTDDLLGVHMIGPQVSELIAEAALAIELGASAEDIALTVHTHPTLPESFMEATEAIHNLAVHVYQPANRPSRQPVKA